MSYVSQQLHPPKEGLWQTSLFVFLQFLYANKVSNSSDIVAKTWKCLGFFTIQILCKLGARVLSTFPLIWFCFL